MKTTPCPWHVIRRFYRTAMQDNNGDSKYRNNKYFWRNCFQTFIICNLFTQPSKTLSLLFLLKKINIALTY